MRVDSGGFLDPGIGIRQPSFEVISGLFCRGLPDEVLDLVAQRDRRRELVLHTLV